MLRSESGVGLVRGRRESSRGLVGKGLGLVAAFFILLPLSLLIVVVISFFPFMLSLRFRCGRVGGEL